MATIDSKLLVSDLAIVVVDDTRFGRAVFNSVLSKAGYSDIRVAGSARQALELMGTVPDAVVHGERTVPYGPKAQGGFASMNASATSSPTPTAGADEDLGTGASAN